MSKADDPTWLRCQATIRKLLHALGKDALVYAQSALENEVNEPERLTFFWVNARRCFDESADASSLPSERSTPT
jgi:hypothetical protein